MSDTTRMATLMALSDTFNIVCDRATTAYQLCKAKQGDPARCIKENDQMNACFAQLKEAVAKSDCQKSVDEYSHCIDKKKNYVGYSPVVTCDAEKKKVDECLKTLGLDSMKK